MILFVLNKSEIDIDLYKLGIIFNVSNEFENVSYCTLLKSFHKDFREVNIGFRVAQRLFRDGKQNDFVIMKYRIKFLRMYR